MPIGMTGRVRRDNDIGQVPQRRRSRQRLVCKHVEKRAGQLPALHCGDQIDLIHHLAARHIDQVRARRQQRQRMAVD